MPGPSCWLTIANQRMIARLNFISLAGHVPLDVGISVGGWVSWWMVQDSSLGSELNSGSELGKEGSCLSLHHSDGFGMRHPRQNRRLS